MAEPRSARILRPVLMLVTEPHPDLPEIVRAAVAGGVDWVQYRDKSSSPEVRRRYAFAVQDALAIRTRLFVNGDVMLAKEVGAGVHLPENADGLQAICAQGVKTVGQSVHSVQKAMEAAQSGAAYLVAGTIFPSGSHPNTPPAGLDFLHAVCCAVPIPVFAIGGVTPENVPDCLAAGAAGVAVLSPVMRSEDPKRAAAAYRAALDGWKERP